MVKIRDNTDSPSPEDGQGSTGSSSDPAWLEASILASASDDARAMSPDRGAGGDAEQRMVLVVAAEADMRTYVRRCLAQVASVQVMEAPDVAGMRGIARAMPPDLIVVDVDGEPAGAAVDRMLGGQPELIGVPAIVITDEAPGGDRGTIGTGTAPGVLLVKPFNARRLCAEVYRLLELGRGD
jgi:DNA-binding NtrC family response regulator